MARGTSGSRTGVARCEAQARTGADERTLETWRLGGVVGAWRTADGEYLYDTADLDAVTRDLTGLRSREAELPLAGEASRLARLLRDECDRAVPLTLVAERLSAWAGAASCRIDMVCGETAVSLAEWSGSGLAREVAPPSSWRIAAVSRAALAGETRAPTVILDVGSLDDAQRRSLPEPASSAVSVGFLPLVHAGRIAGMAVFADEKANTYCCLADPDPLLLGVVAAAVATAALERRAESLSGDPLVAVSTGDAAGRSGAGLRGLAERLVRTFDASACDVYLVDGAFLQPILSVGDQEDDDQAYFDALFALDDYPLSRRALETGHPVSTSSLASADITERERGALESWGYQAQVSIPVIVAGESRFLAEVYDVRPRDFEKDVPSALHICEEMSRFAAGALEIEYLRRRGAALQDLVDLAAGARAAADRSTMVRDMAPRLLGALQATAVDICQVDGDRIEYVVCADLQGIFAGEDQPSARLHDFPLTAQVLKSGEALVVKGAGDPRLSAAERRVFTSAGFESEVCVPLLVGREAIGFIDVFDIRRRDFTPYAEPLTTVARGIAAALESLRLLDEVNSREARLADLACQLEKTNARLQDIVDTSLETGATLDLEEVVASAARRMCAVTDGEWCDIFAVEGQRLRALASDNGHARDEGFVGSTYPISQFGLSRLAVETMEPVVSSNVFADPRAIEGDRDAARQWGYTAALSLPLVSRGKVVGLAECFARHDEAFGDPGVLRALGQTVAQAIANAQLFAEVERATRRLQTVAEISLELVSTLDWQGVLDSVARRLCEVTDMTGCDVMRLVDDDTLELLASVVDGVEDPDWQGVQFHLADWHADKLALESGRALGFSSLSDPRLSETEREMLAGYDVKSFLVAPLPTPAGIIGSIELSDNRREREFSDDELTMVEAVSRVAALAIRNAELHESVKSQKRSLSGLLEAQRAVTGSVVFEHVLNEIARAAATMLSAPECVIWEYDAVTEMLVERTYYTEDPLWRDYTLGVIDPIEARPAEASVLFGGEPLLEHVSDPGVCDATRASMEEWGEKTRLTVPLTFAGEPLGLIVIIDSREERAFAAQETAALVALGEQAATAVHNARLYRLQQEETRQREALLEASRAISSPVFLREVLGNVARAAATALACSECVILTYDQSSGMLTQETVYRAETGQYTMSQTTFPLADYPGGERLIFGHEVLHESLFDDSLDAATRADMERNDEKSCLTIPLAVGAQPVGILVLIETEHDRRFGPIEVDLARGIGEQAAVAIRNATLYEDIRRMHVANLRGLSTALGAKDYYTLGHAARVAGYTVLLGERLGWSKDYIERVETAAFLHDIGKIGIADSVLLKHGALNDEEWELVKRHPDVSAEILGPVLEDDLVDGVHHHHERFGGGGYPDGLAGEEIPLLARALCVADSYDAMSSLRPYHTSMPYRECVAELERCRGEQFDPQVVDAFLDVLRDLERRRRRLLAVAAEAAARIDPHEHASLRTRADEHLPAYERQVAVLREVRDAHPGVRFITTHAVVDKRYILVGDAEEDSGPKSHIGDETPADEEIQACMAGETLDIVTLFADQFGLWLSASVPIRLPDGDIVGVVAADEPAVPTGAVSGLHAERESALTAALEHQAHQLSRAELEAVTDGLTGLYDHGYVQDRLSEEVERAERTGAPLSVVFCDLDHFKDFNDRYGHRAGDDALRQVARVVEKCIRRVDVAARYGGEELIVILTDTGLDAALDVAERIRREVAATSPGPGRERMTVSVGVATYPQHARTKAELLDRVDWAMYRAKRRGRNQVIACGEEDTVGAAERDCATDYRRLLEVAEAVHAKRSGSIAGPQTAYTTLAAALADELGVPLEERAVVVEAARLHDIGQVGVPDAILDQPRRLTAEEWEVVRAHPRIGARLVAESGGAQSVAETIAHHHEHWDGGGYPDGLVGTETPLASRIISVVDAFCAMGADRPQRGRRSEREALLEIQRRSGAQFDPGVVAALNAVLARREPEGTNGQSGRDGATAPEAT